MKACHWLIGLVCLVLICQADGRRRRIRSTCVIQPRLQDKWHFNGISRRIFLRVRGHQMIYRHSSKKIVKFRCLQNEGNMFLLRKRNYKKGQDGILCLGFNYIADHPKAEYLIIRLIGQGEGSDLMSPVLLPKRTRVSLKTHCKMDDGFDQDQRTSYARDAFISRASPGCRFPTAIQGRWNYTYQHARSFEIWSKNATLHLMNGKSIRFLCNKKDGGVYVFRANHYVKHGVDAIMCAEFSPMPDDPFYSFQVSRHNSGQVLDGQLRPVSSSKPVYIQIDCDWMGSPARPEFLYP